MSTSREPESRRALRSAGRILIKASALVNEDGRPSLTRLGVLCDQIAEVHRRGVEVIVVSSGATGMGRRLMLKQGRMNMTVAEAASIADGSYPLKAGIPLGSRRPSGSRMKCGLSNELFNPLIESKEIQHARRESKRTYDSACAAAGQFKMMDLFKSFLSQAEVSAAQILLTEDDLRDKEGGHLANLQYSIERLISVGIVPIIDENNAIVGKEESDQLSMAAMCARSFECDVMILLAHMDGIFDGPPSEHGARPLPFFYCSHTEKFFEGNSKIVDAARLAVGQGSRCGACIVLSGSDLDTVRSVMGEYDPSVGQKGTLFATPGSELEKQALREVEASQADESAKLQALSPSRRKAILHIVANALKAEAEHLLDAADKIDPQSFEEDGMKPLLVQKPKLTHDTCANEPALLSVVTSRHGLANGQKAAFAIASGKEWLLKCRNESGYSIKFIHQAISQGIEKGGRVSSNMLKLHTVPRASEANTSLIIVISNQAGEIHHVYAIDENAYRPLPSNSLQREKLKSIASCEMAMSVWTCPGRTSKATETGLCNFAAAEMKCEDEDLTFTVNVTKGTDEAPWIS